MPMDSEAESIEPCPLAGREELPIAPEELGVGHVRGRHERDVDVLRPYPQHASRTAGLPIVLYPQSTWRTSPVVAEERSLTR